MIADNNLLVLQQEWTTLQTQFDSYEKHSLFVKLFSIALTSIALFAFNASCWALLLSAVLWLQDGIWKTYQSRIAVRLEKVEQGIKQCLIQVDCTELGMQFNSLWNEQRAGAMSLVIEYIKQSIKPTVAYPHVLLIAGVLLTQFINI